MNEKVKEKTKVSIGRFIKTFKLELTALIKSSKPSRKLAGKAVSKEWTQERIREFWERCGFEYSFVTNALYKKAGMKFWYTPDGFVYGEDLPDITDLNALFKYAIPVYVMKTGRDFMSIPTTLSPEELATRIAEAIDKALEEKKG